MRIAGLPRRLASSKRGPPSRRSAENAGASGCAPSVASCRPGRRSCVRRSCSTLPDGSGPSVGEVLLAEQQIAVHVGDHEPHRLAHADAPAELAARVGEGPDLERAVPRAGSVRRPRRPRPRPRSRSSGRRVRRPCLRARAPRSSPPARRDRSRTRRCACRADPPCARACRRGRGRRTRARGASVVDPGPARGLPPESLECAGPRPRSRGRRLLLTAADAEREPCDPQDERRAGSSHGRRLTSRARRDTGLRPCGLAPRLKTRRAGEGAGWGRVPVREAEEVLDEDLRSAVRARGSRAVSGARMATLRCRRMRARGWRRAGAPIGCSPSTRTAACCAPRRGSRSRACRTGWRRAASRCRSCRAPAHVTLGGMVASDVHGKNHHGAGTLGAHLRALRLALADGRELEVSETQRARAVPRHTGRHGPHRARARGRARARAHLLRLDLTGDRAAPRPRRSAGAPRRARAGAGPSPSPGWIGRARPRARARRVDHGPLGAAGRGAGGRAAPRFQPTLPVRCCRTGLLNRASARLVNEAYGLVTGARSTPASSIHAPTSIRSTRARVESRLRPARLHAVPGADPARGRPRGGAPAARDRSPRAASLPFLCVVKDFGAEGRGHALVPAARHHRVDRPAAARRGARRRWWTR